MADTKEIKNKIGSVKNTGKITKAMEMVAASKMKKAIDRTLATRPYADHAFRLLVSLSQDHDAVSHPLLRHGQPEKILLVVISSNRGLCGSYNAALAKDVLRYIKKRSDQEIEMVTVGRYAEKIARRLKLPLKGSFVDLPDNLELAQVRGLFRLIHDEFKTGQYYKVAVAYTHYLSALSRQPTIKQLMPIKSKSIRNILEDLAGEHVEVEGMDKKISQYLLEPSAEEVFTSILAPLVEAILYEMILESMASEHSARMFAMRNATDNANRLASDLTVSYNRVRQEGITKEISEIVSGSNF